MSKGAEASECRGHLGRAKQPGRTEPLPVLCGLRGHLSSGR